MVTRMSFRDWCIYVARPLSDALFALFGVAIVEDIRVEPGEDAWGRGCPVLYRSYWFKKGR